MDTDRRWQCLFCPALARATDIERDTATRTRWGEVLLLHRPPASSPSSMSGIHDRKGGSRAEGLGTGVKSASSVMISEQCFPSFEKPFCISQHIASAIFGLHVYLRPNKAVRHLSSCLVLEAASARFHATG